MMVYELDDIERGVLMGQPMTEHDRIRKERAESCDRGDRESLQDAIRGLQSTDHPDLVPLHDELQAQLASRTFDEGRREQGFKSQGHLDAWFRYYDHTKSCEECQKPGEGMVLEDNSIQPTQRRCAIAQQLYAEVDAVKEGQAGVARLGALFTLLVLIVCSLVIGYACGRKGACEAPASSVTKPVTK